MNEAEAYLNPRLAEFSDSELRFELRQRAMRSAEEACGMRELLELRMIDGVPRRAIAWNDHRRWVLAEAWAMKGLPQRLIADYLGLAESTIHLQITKFTEKWDGPRRPYRLRCLARNQANAAIGNYARRDRSKDSAADRELIWQATERYRAAPARGIQ